jgi:hypothetical protein
MLVIGVIFSIAAAVEFVPILVGCGIKGNINFKKGERIDGRNRSCLER